MLSTLGRGTATCTSQQTATGVPSTQELVCVLLLLTTLSSCDHHITHPMFLPQYPDFAHLCSSPKPPHHLHEVTNLQEFLCPGPFTNPTPLEQSSPKPAAWRDASLYNHSQLNPILSSPSEAFQHQLLEGSHLVTSVFWQQLFSGRGKRKRNWSWNWSGSHSVLHRYRWSLKLNKSSLSTLSQCPS